jgi:uncharacterized protein (TIGR02996 family)
MSQPDYTAHPTFRLLLAAVLASPDDDLPRLVLADWLEELQTEEAAARAEWIREACANPSWEFVWMVSPSHSRPVELLGLHGWAWSSNDDGSYLIHGECRYWFDRGFISKVSAPLGVLLGGDKCGRCEGRGFYGKPDHDNPISAYSPDRLTPEGLPRVSCPRCSGTGRVPGVLKGLVQVEPVTSVVVTDREPSPVFDGPIVYWQCSDSSRAAWVPYSLIEAMYAAERGGPGDTGDADGRTAIHFTSADLARAALSTALLSLARESTPSPSLSRPLHAAVSSPPG